MTDAHLFAQDALETMESLPLRMQNAILEELYELAHASEGFVGNFDGIRRCRVSPLPHSPRRRSRSSRRRVM